MASLKGLQKRYERSLEQEDFYGAEQACRMMHHRLTQAKDPSPDQLKQAMEILLSGCQTLLKHGQVQAATALGLLVTKHFVDYEVPVNDENASVLLMLSDAYQTTPLSDEGKRERLRFLKSAVSWSTKQSVQGFRFGYPKINTAAANAAADIGDYEAAQRWYVRSDDPVGAAISMFKYACDETLPSEIPLVLTRSVLAYLVAENIADAGVFRAKFAQLSAWPSVSDGAASSDSPPLANFCELLIKICQLETSAATLFRKIRSSYDSELSRDKNFAKQLTKVGQIYFDIQPPQPSGLAGVMGNMLRGMVNT